MSYTCFEEPVGQERNHSPRCEGNHSWTISQTSKSSTVVVVKFILYFSKREFNKDIPYCRRIIFSTLKSAISISFVLNILTDLCNSKIAEKFSGFLSKKYSGGSPGTNSSQSSSILWSLNLSKQRYSVFFLIGLDCHYFLFDVYIYVFGST